VDTTNRAGEGSFGVNEICAWFNRERTAQLDEERVAQLYFAFHPRTVFLKTLASRSEVVDIGAGDGSLSVFRSWPEPSREDLRMYAYSIERGRLFDDFSGYELSDWNANQPEFDGRRFDAIVCAHFIEHIQDPTSLVKWAARKLNPGGRIYLEWPSAGSLSLPPRTELEEMGVPLIISRFDDDGTHQALPDADLVAAAMRENGLSIEARGIIRLPWIEDEMLAHHKHSADGFYRQAAFWSYTGWCQYIVAGRVPTAQASEPAPAIHTRAATDQSPQAQIDELRQRLATLQIEHMGSISRARTLEKKLSDVEGLLAQERARAAADADEKLRLLTEREQENRRLLVASEDLRKVHEQMLNSRSWKLTRPLRALANRLRGH
jgi:SAM-dependent methyltransferase